MAKETKGKMASLIKDIRQQRALQLKDSGEVSPSVCVNIN